MTSSWVMINITHNDQYLLSFSNINWIEINILVGTRGCGFKYLSILTNKMAPWKHIQK